MGEKLLDRMRRVLCTGHYSYRTEQAYVHWVPRFIRFHDLRHPRDLGKGHVEAFLTYLAVDRHVAPSTQNLALNAIQFLYQKVLELELPWLDNVVRAKRSTRLPVVRTIPALQVQVDRALAAAADDASHGRGVSVHSAPLFPAHCRVSNPLPNSSQGADHVFGLSYSPLGNIALD